MAPVTPNAVHTVGVEADSQVETHVPWFLFARIQEERARTACMVAGWIVNLDVAESLTARARMGQVS